MAADRDNRCCSRYYGQYVDDNVPEQLGHDLLAQTTFCDGNTIHFWNTNLFVQKKYIIVIFQRPLFQLSWKVLLLKFKIWYLSTLYTEEPVSYLILIRIYRLRITLRSTLSE